MVHSVRALLVALLVVGATVAIARPADAAGDTYDWVATNDGGTHVASDAANWVRESDGQHGVPGSLDTARAVSPATPLVIDSTWTVSELDVVGAAEDGTIDVRTANGATFHATSVSLNGDSDLGLGSVTISSSLTISGTFTFDGHLGSTSDRAQLVLDGAHGTNGSSFSSGAVDVTVVGTHPSSISRVAIGEPSLDLDDGVGGTFVGHIDAVGPLRIVGDLPSQAHVVEHPNGPGGTVGPFVWDEPTANLDGELDLPYATDRELPDQLTINGLAEITPPFAGGSITVGPTGTLALSSDHISRPFPFVALDGTFSAAPGASLLTDAIPRCAGDEDLIVRAADGIDTPTAAVTKWGTVPTGLTPRTVTLGRDLVVVWQRAADDTCSGGNQAIVHALYRDVLARLADAGGSTYWTGKLDGGASQSSIASGLLATREAKVAFARSTFAVWSCTSDAPSTEQVNSAADQLQAGVSLAVVRADVIADTVPDNGDPVTCLYHGVLGRTPDSGGRAYVEGRLASGESVQTVARKLMTTSEGRRVQFNRLYQHLLGRNATADEVTAGVDLIHHHETELDITARLAGTAEYAGQYT
ncbi:MAG: DUF4214 domain-containing protein [Pseudonocardia sp.]|nr:DUF4214 domain-containing protein [Pseudonocardia sp.]